MEIFIDGGLFEILIAGLLTTLLNFVFSKKVLLVLFSLIAIAAPVLLLFIHSGEWVYFFIGICLFNAVFFVALLWKKKSETPNAPLINFTYKKLFRKQR